MEKFLAVVLGFDNGTLAQGGSTGNRGGTGGDSSRIQTGGAPSTSSGVSSLGGAGGSWTTGGTGTAATAGGGVSSTMSSASDQGGFSTIHTGGTPSNGGAATGGNSASGGAGFAGSGLGGTRPATGGASSAGYTSGGSANPMGGTSPGGNATTGGEKATGGKSTTGGATSGLQTGGTTSTSAATATGGAPTGGSTATGGSPATGGNPATGGISSTVNCSAAMPTSGTQHCTTANTQGTADGQSWWVWATASSNSGCMTTFDNATAFSALWVNNGDLIARLGIEWGSGGKTYDQYGTIAAQFVEKKTQGSTVGGYSYIGAYGWSSSPCVEYYIVDDSFGTFPLTVSGGTLKGSGTIDGDTYRFYQVSGVSAGGSRCSSIWDQYWSVRQTRRTCGTITISDHFRWWADAGMALGTLIEAKIVVEVGGGPGSIEFPIATVTTSQ